MSSIRDVARHAGCSTSTVSRVINNRDAVDPATRKKVLESIDILGYKPNLVAQGLRVKKGNLIGLVVPSGTEHAFGAVIRHSLDIAHEKGYNIIVVNSHEDPDLEESYISDLLRRNINGIIFSRVSDESRIMPKIMNRNIPIVVIDRAFENEKVPHVVLDNYKAGYIAGEYLSALEHVDIACITGSMKITLCRERFNGFQQALSERGIELLNNNVYEGDFSFQSGLTAIRTLGCEGGCRFTAVFAMNDLMALGVMKGLHSSGLKVPDDVSVLGMDDLEFGNMVTPALSSIHYPFGDMVEQALNLLLMQIEEERLVNDTIILDPHVSVKESTETCRVTKKEMERIRDHE